MTYIEPPLTATEIEHRLRRYLDELVALAGGPLTVFRVASRAASGDPCRYPRRRHRGRMA